MNVQLFGSVGSSGKKPRKWGMVRSGPDTVEMDAVPCEPSPLPPPVRLK